MFYPHVNSSFTGIYCSILVVNAPNNLTTTRMTLLFIALSNLFRILHFSVYLSSLLPKRVSPGMAAVIVVIGLVKVVDLAE